MTSFDAGEPYGSEVSDLKGMRILLVEDSWSVGIALKRLLRILGAEVDGPVATGAEAQRLVSQHRPDVALVDFNLRGGEKADRLIDQLHDQGIFVIVASGYANLTLELGKAAAILEKPLDEAKLIAALRLARR
jgi:CheY-like chemotaxis protein